MMSIEIPEGQRKVCGECHRDLEGKITHISQIPLKDIDKDAYASNIDSVRDRAGEHISPMALDDSGEVLLIEYKRKDEDMPVGQARLLDALSRKDGISVVIVEGNILEPLEGTQGPECLIRVHWVKGYDSLRGRLLTEKIFPSGEWCTSISEYQRAMEIIWEDVKRRGRERIAGLSRATIGQNSPIEIPA